MEDKNQETDGYHSQAHMISTHPGANPISHHIPHHPEARQEFSNEPPPPPPPAYEEKSNNKGKWILIFLIIFFLILIPTSLFFFLNYTNKSTENKPSPTPTQGVACTQEALICPDGTSVGRQGPNCEFAPCPTGTASAKMETFTSAKFPDMSLKGYTLNFPSTWTASEERDESAQISKLILSKDGYSLTILQAPMGGGGCIFEGETPAGPFTDYRNSKTTDIKTAFGNLRKAEDVSNNTTNYNYCQESIAGQNSYGTITSIGVISAKGPVNPDPKIVSEIDEMLKNVKTK